MRKTTRILSIATIAAQLLSLLVLIIVILFQRQLKGLYTNDPQMIDMFQFPVVDTLYLLLATLIIAAIAVFTGFLKPNKIVLPELLGIIVLVLFLPLLQPVGTLIEKAVMQRYGATALASYITLRNLTSYALTLSKLASSLALVVCGMSFALKKLTVRKPR